MLISELQKLKFSKMIKDRAVKLGFFACGISRAGHLQEEESRMEAWLARGKHGEMSWLERNREKRYNPERLVPGAKSVITVLYNYAPTEQLPEEDNYRISNYAYGTDYHKVVKEKLYLLLQYLEEETGKSKARVFVDSAPVLDRAWAHRAGLGFIGKNTLLINREGGSYLFIGHIITQLEIAPDQVSPEKSFCGSCTLCIQACPTDALEPFDLDARKCISYLTIEHRSSIPEEFIRKDFHNWIFGCDICQEVCPWNREVKPHDEPRFGISERLRSMKKTDWENMDEETFQDIFSGSAVQRAGFNGLKRNISFLME